MIKIKRNCKEIEGSLSERNRSENRAKTRKKQGKNRGLQNRHFAAKPFCSLRPLSAKIFATAKQLLAHECHLVVQEPPFLSYESGCEPPKHEILHFAGKAPFRKVFRSCEADFGTRVPFRSTVTLISQLRNDCEVPKREKSQFRSQSSISQGVLQLRNGSEA